jgi:hypothetical protein
VNPLASYLTLRDRRLEGGVPSRRNMFIVNTNASTSLTTAFSEINAYSARAGGLHSMFIMCHGYAGQNVFRQMSMDAGGEGLQLGREDVLHGNVSLWNAIKNRVQNIVVCSCAAANTEAGNRGTTSDGRYLMGALAIHTNASVYAADRIQWYDTYKNLANGRFEFGTWEGYLWHFPPSGAPPTHVAGPPVEFSDVMAGTAL